jgi:hypothetical protein
MSVNRQKHGRNANDALWNCKDGGRYENCGVMQIAVAAFDQKWQHTTLANVSFFMRPVHKPTRCNYPHCEVVVFKEEDGKATPQTAIKPLSVKLKIRQDLGEHLTVVLPAERWGEQFAL